MASTIVTSRPRARDVAATSAPMNPAPMTTTCWAPPVSSARSASASSRLRRTCTPSSPSAAGRRRGTPPVAMTTPSAAISSPEARTIRPPVTSSRSAATPRCHRASSSSMSDCSASARSAAPIVAEQVLLGQWRTVVGQVRLGADDDEVVVVALGPQLLRGPQPGQRGSDHGDRPPGHATPCSGLGPRRGRPRRRQRSVPERSPGPGRPRTRRRPRPARDRYEPVAWPGARSACRSAGRTRPRAAGTRSCSPRAIPPTATRPGACRCRRSRTARRRR